MKVIDLLNKIANGEQVPKNIKHQYYNYKWNVIDKDYQKSDGEMLLGNMSIQYHLNDEIILIEDKENEIDVQDIKEYKSNYVMNSVESEMQDKINELVRAIKQLDKKIKE